MKRVWIALIMLGLLLTGCAENTEPDATAPMPESTAPGLYQPESAVEQATEGAVRRYDLPGESYSWIAGVGDQLLLAISVGETTDLMILGGPEGRPGATAQLPLNLAAENACWRATHSGFAYFDPQSSDVVFLDTQLQEQDRIPMPEQMMGTPLISEDGSQVFYCTDSEIRVIETEHKISRLIKSHNCTEQKLLGSYFNGALIGCYIWDMDGNTNQYYLSAENGLTVASDISMSSLFTYDETYLALRQEGEQQQKIVGTRTGNATHLPVSTPIAPALELGGIVGYDATENGVNFAFYELSAGTQTATVTVTDVAQPQMILADRWSGCVWVLTRDLTADSCILLRWDISQASAK